MLFVFCASLVIVQAVVAQLPNLPAFSSTNDSVTIFDNPSSIYDSTQTSSTCILTELAKKEIEENFVDIIMRLSESNRRYGQCPSEQESQETGTGIITARIFGGQVSQRGRWPWMAYVFETQTCKGICGGTLLGKEWILTAAHCIGTTKPNLYGVVLGEHRISKIKEPFEMHRLLKKILVHPQFDSFTFNNDVALLQLIKPVFFTHYVRPACLPSLNISTDRPGPSTLIGDQSCMAMGWGVTKAGSSSASDVMNEVHLNIRPSFICRLETTRSRTRSPPVIISEAKFCAGGEGNRDTCMGDSGGPLVCSVNGIYNVIGVTSYGEQACGQEGKFGIYAKVTLTIK